MVHLHSVLRYAVLVLLIIAVVKSLIGWFQKKEFNNGDQKIGLFLMISAHLQLVLGLALYFMRGWATLPMAESMADAGTRFWKVEHLTAMLVAIVLITIGRMKAKRLNIPLKQHRTQVIFYGIALVLILWAIPWDVTRLY